MKSALQSLAISFCAVFGALTCADAGTVTVDPTASWQGYMNVFETPQHGGGFVFGSSWGTPDLTATFSGPVLTLGPNTIGDPSSFWYTPSGGPGAVGNKSMDANMYVETTGVYTGQTLTFSGNVLANTLFGHVNQIGNGCQCGLHQRFRARLFIVRFRDRAAGEWRVQYQPCNG